MVIDAPAPVKTEAQTQLEAELRNVQSLSDVVSRLKFTVVDEAPAQPEPQINYTRRKWEFVRMAEKIINGSRQNTDAPPRRFEIDDANTNQISDLFNYFHGIKGNLELHKGIWISGVRGCGKTIVMKAFGDFCAHYGLPTGFKFASMKRIEADFKARGYKAIEAHTFNPVTNSYGITNDKPFSLCIDDIGTELQTTSEYGNKYRLSEEILYLRYELFTDHGFKTHVTTNLSFGSKEGGNPILERIGERAYSRIDEMFNFVELFGSDRRK